MGLYSCLCKICNYERLSDENRATEGAGTCINKLINMKRVNNNADALLFTHKVCVEAPQTLGSHRRIRLREILLACLRAKRFDMKVKMQKVIFAWNGSNEKN